MAELPQNKLIEEIEEALSIDNSHSTFELLFEKYPDEIDWNFISEYPRLSEKFIEKFQEEVNWELICMYQKLSQKFIEKHHDNVEWDIIGGTQKLSNKFILKHLDKLDINEVIQEQKLTEKTIRKIKFNLNELAKLFEYQNLSENYIEEFFIFPHGDGNLYIHNFCWQNIVQYQKLSEKFIKKYWHKLHHGMALEQESLTPDFLLWLYKTDQEDEYYFLKKRNDEFCIYGNMIEEQLPKVLIEFLDDNEENILSTSRISAPRLNYINVGLSLDNIVAQCPTYEMSGITEYIHIRYIDI